MYIHTHRPPIKWRFGTHTTGAHSPSSRDVFPLPSYPHTSDGLSRGNARFRSTSTTLFRGLRPALAPRARSCGHVTVAPWNATGTGVPPSGGTGATSAPCKYFLMRRGEKRLCAPGSGSKWKSGSGLGRKGRTGEQYLEHVDERLWERVERELHLGVHWRTTRSASPRTNRKPSITRLLSRR